jgi:Protein RETICULATA-related
MRAFASTPPSSLRALAVASLCILLCTDSVQPLAPPDSKTRRINPLQKWRRDARLGWEARTNADPNFAFKSTAEVALAALTQLSAEWKSRGLNRMLPEVDFVVGGVVTAIAGKYFAMWRVAPTRAAAATATVTADAESAEAKAGPMSQARASEPRVFGMAVPTNAFQPRMMDGTTRPTPAQRGASLLAPVVPLFRAGIASSAVGYGLTHLFVRLRELALPSYVPATQHVNIVHASIYTGAFMATVSNVRYQVLQGVVEPWVAKACESWGGRAEVRNAIIFAIRIANGILGSLLAIAGMRWLGLQRLKS